MSVTRDCLAILEAHKHCFITHLYDNPPSDEVLDAMEYFISLDGNDEWCVVDVDSTYQHVLVQSWFTKYGKPS